ncbi:MAG: hypothetical protein COB30_005255 [Ectothiorhodospiraceae bacterium]|nr:hypothetical protein [Ectothiorhodospiraceae bacterium]
MKTTFSFVLLACLLSVASLNAAELVIEAGAAGTSSTGSWYLATGATMPYNGNQGMYTLVDNQTKTYTFSTVIPETTQYTVEVYNSCYTPRSQQVIHRITHADGIDTQLVGQDCNLDPLVGQWRTLGTFTFNAGDVGTLVIDTTNSNNVYVGATAVRFVYAATGVNALPVISTASTTITVTEGSTVQVSATVLDTEDGDITINLQWSALGQAGSGGNFSVTAGNQDFTFGLTVTDANGGIATETIYVTVQPVVDTPQNIATRYDFECTTPLESLTGFTTNNVNALPNVGMRCGRYVAELTNNTNNITLHFNDLQGRLDAVFLQFPFRVIARNLGVAPINDPMAMHQPTGSAFNFVGLQVHAQDLSSLNSAHVVVGQRGGTINTIEGKTTLNGESSVTDLGYNILPAGRADIMIVGQANGDLTVYWQLPNVSGNPQNDNWIAYQDALNNPPGTLPGTLPTWNGGVYVGIITYAQGNNGVPFMGVMESFEVVE